jgi:hypothetical protein
MTAAQAAVPLPSERAFGTLFAIVLALLAGYAHYRGWDGRRLAFGALALVFAATTLLAPRALRPLNRAWHALGLLLGKVVNPIVLGVIFFVILTPLALLMRLAGRDELRLRAPRGKQSLWIERDPPGPAPDSFRRQY